MSSQLRDNLRRRTGEMRRRQADAEIEASASSGSVGDLYVLAESGGHPVEWAVLEVLSISRRLVVPVDDQPLVGSADVATEDTGDDSSGDARLRHPCVLRCAFGVEVDRQVLAKGQRTGRVSDAAVAAACEIHRRLQSAHTNGSAMGREVDTEPEYRAFIDDVVRPAHSALVAASQTLTQAGQAVSGAEPTNAAPRAPFARAWAIAASILMFLTALLAWQLAQVYDERADLLTKLRAAKAPIAEAEQQNQKLQRQLHAAEQQRSQLEERLQGVEASNSIIEALINVPLAVLTASSRSEPQILTVTAEAPLVAVLFEIESPDGPYQLSLRGFGDDTEIWSRGGLQAERGVLSVLLPSELIPLGAYRLILRGSDQQHTFTLIVERP